MPSPTLDSVENKILSGERLNREDGLFLLTERCDLLTLGRLAARVRFQKNPERRVTFVVDSNPNYTNVCDTDCLFCAFFRRPGDKEAYTLTVEQVMEKIEKAAGLGATTLLLQGGHNKDIPFSYYLDLVRETKRRFPGVTPHFFSASEVQSMAKASGKTIDGVLSELTAAGQTTLPGGGAEVLSARVRKQLAWKKGGPDRWLDVHRAAHRRGWRSTATMMYGHVETSEDIVEHWDRVRDLQDDTRGFTAFVPWSYKPENSAFFRKHPHRTGPVPYLRILAASRLYLDNIDHVQASWFSEGKKTGQVALHFGADDFGGTLIDENVHAAADFVNKAGVEEVLSLIREAGFTPAQRTTNYDVLKVFDDC